MLTHLPRLMALTGLIAMSAARTGIRAQTPADWPLTDLWRLIRTALTGVDGDKYFNQIISTRSRTRRSRQRNKCLPAGWSPGCRRQHSW